MYILICYFIWILYIVITSSIESKFLVNLNSFNCYEKEIKYYKLRNIQIFLFLFILFLILLNTNTLALSLVTIISMCLIFPKSNRFIISLFLKKMKGGLKGSKLNKNLIKFNFSKKNMTILFFLGISLQLFYLFLIK
jgi:hypothetical protein